VGTRRRRLGKSGESAWVSLPTGEQPSLRHGEGRREACQALGVRGGARPYQQAGKEGRRGSLPEEWKASGAGDCRRRGKLREARPRRPLPAARGGAPWCGAPALTWCGARSSPACLPTIPIHGSARAGFPDLSSPSRPVAVGAHRDAWRRVAQQPPRQRPRIPRRDLLRRRRP
jgi:hypothetical protein